jgi:hypothetical protein
MKPQDLKIGMRVQFGRPNGQHTLAEVIKLNTSTAKLKTLEGRGRKGGGAGVTWKVPYSMIYPTTNTAVTPPQSGPFTRTEDEDTITLAGPANGPASLNVAIEAIAKNAIQIYELRQLLKRCLDEMEWGNDGHERDGLKKEIEKVLG